MYEKNSQNLKVVKELIKKKSHPAQRNDPTYMASVALSLLKKLTQDSDKK